MIEVFGLKFFSTAISKIDVYKHIIVCYFGHTKLTGSIAKPIILDDWIHYLWGTVITKMGYHKPTIISMVLFIIYIIFTSISSTSCVKNSIPAPTPTPIWTFLPARCQINGVINVWHSYFTGAGTGTTYYCDSNAKATDGSYRYCAFTQ